MYVLVCLFKLRHNLKVKKKNYFHFLSTICICKEHDLKHVNLSHILVKIAVIVSVMATAFSKCTVHILCKYAVVM